MTRLQLPIPTLSPLPSGPARRRWRVSVIGILINPCARLVLSIPVFPSILHASRILTTIMFWQQGPPVATVAPPHWLSFLVFVSDLENLNVLIWSVLLRWVLEWASLEYMLERKKRVLVRLWGFYTWESGYPHHIHLPPSNHIVKYSIIKCHELDDEWNGSFMLVY